MTTIVYRDGILAADSAVTQGPYVGATPATKVYRSEDGRLIAICGDYTDCMRLVTWLMRLPEFRSSNPPEMSSESRVVEIVGKDRIRTWEGKGYFDSRAKFAAWGSGMAAALGAMHMGANARAAVRVAAKVDPYTRAPIRSVSL